MNRNVVNSWTAAWALIAYLGFSLFATPCSCDAAPTDLAQAAACCCGPDAKTPCAPATPDGKRGACEGHLGADCAHALPEAIAADPAAAGDSLSLPSLAPVLSFELASPEAALVAASRARTASPPLSRLDQVRSTVLLI